MIYLQTWPIWILLAVWVWLTLEIDFQASSKTKLRRMKRKADRKIRHQLFISKAAPVAFPVYRATR